jgi:hypothetical protein
VGLVGGQCGFIDVHIEVSFTRLDPPEGRAARLIGGDPRRAVDSRAFVGWLGLLGVLQLLTNERVETPRS